MDELARPTPKTVDLLKTALRNQDGRDIFALRVGIIDDPRIVRKKDQDGNLDPPLDPLLHKAEEFELDIVNTATGCVAIRWIDGGLGGGVLLPSEPVDNLHDALSKAVEIVPSLCTGIWGGQHPVTGQLTVCGYEFMPPVGSVVLVGFIRGGKPIILGYWLPHYSSLFNKQNSRYPTLTPGEIRISSFGGSYIHITNSKENSKNEGDQQISDILIQHVKGSNIRISSKVDDQYGELAIMHGSGTGIVFTDKGGMEFRQKSFDDNTADSPQSRFSLNGTDGSSAIESIGDISLKAHTYLTANGNGIMIDSSKELSVKANENSSFNFNKSLNFSVNETLLLTTNKKAFLNFKGGLQIEANGNSLIKGGGDLLVRRSGNIDMRTSTGTITLVGVTAPGIGPSAAGIVTANTFCPITGPHIGAIGNSCKASTLAPIAPNAPM